MGQQLNIKDAATVALARDLARQLGRSVTAVVREALEEKARQREAAEAAADRDLDECLDSFRRANAERLAGQDSRSLMDAIYVDGLPE